MESIIWVITVLIAIGVVAVLSFLFKSRRFFLVSSLGALVGSLFPGHPQTTGGWLHSVSLYQGGVAWSTALGAMLAVVLFYLGCWLFRDRREPLQ